MNTLTKKIALSSLVMLLSACAHYPNRYNPGAVNGPYYSGSSYGAYQDDQYYYPTQPATGYWGGNSRPYGGYQSNNYYYENNNYYNRPHYQKYPPPGYGYQGNRLYTQPRDYGNRPPNWGGWQGRYNQAQPRQPQPAYEHHDRRNFSPARRDNQANGGWQRDNDNRERNRDGWQDRNNQRQVRQQPIADPPEARRYPQANRPGQGNGTWRGNQQENNPNRQENRGGWQNQNNPRQPRQQPPQVNNEARNRKFEATYDRIQNRIMQSSGQNGNGQHNKKRKQDNDS